MCLADLRRVCHISMVRQPEGANPTRIAGVSVGGFCCIYRAVGRLVSMRPTHPCAGYVYGVRTMRNRAHRRPHRLDPRAVASWAGEPCEAPVFEAILALLHGCGRSLHSSLDSKTWRRTVIVRTVLRRQQLCRERKNIVFDEMEMSLLFLQRTKTKKLQ